MTRLGSLNLPGVLYSSLGLAVVVLTAACISIHDHKGVANLWRDEATPLFESGVTTRAEVLSALGPPSQVIDLEEGLIFYYMRERSKGKGLVLILYNTSSVKVDYDRAIFFFDGEGLLVEQALSKESFPLEVAQ